MHQTFYIDIDEEITSIVERLKKAKAKELVIVVPKRALLIQSIINLKLLKKEADKLKKEIIIVTQDKLGKMLIEKTGIIVEQRLDGVENDAEEIFDETKTEAENFSTARKFTAQKNDLEDLGSESYFDSTPKKIHPPVKIEMPEKEAVEKIINKELVSGVGGEMQSKFFSKKATQALDMVKNIDIQQKGPEEKMEVLARPSKRNKKAEIFSREDFSLEEGEEEKVFSQGKAEDFFSRVERSRKKEERDVYQNVKVGGKAWKAFFWFCFTCLLLAVLAGGYLYIPQATIILEPKVSIKPMDFEIKGSKDLSEINLAEDSIPVKVIDLEEEISEVFPATGSKSDSNKKARGTITIYNEFSASAQPLVATTRFLSENGKLFRLEKSIVVPGTTLVAGETKSGVIEAEVMADESGESFNIGPSRFSIPGFQGSGGGKYEKIYAKSSKMMIGGGDSGTEMKTISATDIENAKKKLTAELQEKLKQKVKEQGGEEQIVLDDAINFRETAFSSSAQEGLVVGEFSLQGKAGASFIVFQKNHLEKLLTEKIISANGIGKEQIGRETFKFEFGKADADFANGKLVIRTSLKVRILPSLNLEEIKKAIMGKTEDEFVAYIRQYKELDNADIEYNSPFPISKIPSFPNRVHLSLDNN